MAEGQIPDVHIRKVGKAGHITLQRPSALNALTQEMCIAVREALVDWRSDHDVENVIIDAEGERAFCAGGDVALMYRAGKAGDTAFGRAYWRNEYLLDATIATWPKPVITFLHGITMGGGVGIGCHASHRIVAGNSEIAMPECAIGIVPDVGGSWLLARAPGRTGECLAVTGLRMGAGDAIACGFADTYCPRETWPRIKADLQESGRVDVISQNASQQPASGLMTQSDKIGSWFSASTLPAVKDRLVADGSALAHECLARMERNAPLAMHCALELVRRQRHTTTIHSALEYEFRYTARAVAHADFLEGVRAQLIDKDMAPRWLHSAIGDVRPEEVEAMLAPNEDAVIEWRQ